MVQSSRRDFLKLAAAGSAFLATGHGMKGHALAGTIKLENGNKDFSPVTNKERQMIATSCWQCVTRDAMVGYIEDGRLVKLEGNENSIRTKGKLCSKGQAGINQVYDPDRVLYPMKRTGKRGEGKWKRISWDEALGEITERLKKLRDAGTPEKFMFHYGRMKGSSSAMIKDIFLPFYGTGTVGNHTSICEGGKFTAQELTWGKSYDNWDFDNTKFVLNFGCNIFEAHTNHIPLSQRLVSAVVEKGVRLVTFDVRLSNTAAKSTEWVPVKPGTDGAVVLAMCNVIMGNDLYDKEIFTFIKATEGYEASLDEKVASLKAHLKQYTPQWAEGISGVSASKIEALAREFATTKPAIVMSYRGAVAHYNGNDTERAIQMLAVITGNIDNPGGRCIAVGPKWEFPKGPKDKPEEKKLKILDGNGIKFPTHHSSHQIFKMIKEGSHGRPEVYMWFCHAPVYANGEVQENIDVLKDETLLPYTICVNPFYDESAALADMILPDATYLERWGWEDMVSPAQIPEFYIRQPLIKPMGESRDFADVCCDLAERLGFPLGFKTREEFVKMSCDMTKEIKDIGGFDYMKEKGVWSDPKAKPKYFSYKKEAEKDKVENEDVVYDKETGVYWNWKKSKAHDAEEAKGKGYTHMKYAYKGYVGQKIGDKIYKGFVPDKVNKSGYFELYSNLMKEAGLSPLPVYTSIPVHEKMGADELILTTYKVAVQTQARSANCKWLTEIYHENPACINSKSADKLGIKTGDKIKVKSSVGEIITTAKVTEGVVPGVISISHHLGHWEYGRYASGKKGIDANDNDTDLKFKWWDTYGVHPNWIIPNSPDPVNGQQSWMDTVVKVVKV